MAKSRTERRPIEKAERKRLKRMLKSQEKSPDKESHRSKESKGNPQFKDNNAKHEVTRERRRFSNMDIVAFPLAGLATLALALFGIFYSSHKTLV
jgi:hypothetical protein